MSVKSVCFNPVHTVHMTYSADEYDRSCFAFTSSPEQYTLYRPKVAVASAASTDTIITQANDHNRQTSPSHSRPAITPLDLSVISNSRRRMMDSPGEDSQAYSAVLPQKRCKKPKLTINTQSLTPLIFTNLTTHYKCKNEDEEEEHGYLIPVSAC